MQHITSSKGLKTGDILIKTPDKGKSGTFYRIHFLGNHVYFIPFTNVSTENGQTSYQNLDKQHVTITKSSKQHLENYLQHANSQFPLCLISH